MKRFWCWWMYGHEWVATIIGVGNHAINLKCRLCEGKKTIPISDWSYRRSL